MLPDCSDYYTSTCNNAIAAIDTTYGHAIQFLIDEKFMTIPFDQESSTSIERSL